MHLQDLNQFKYIEIDGGFSWYYSYKTDSVELCLERCLNGYDVALYDNHQELLYPKVCTNLTGLYSSLEAIRRALTLAEGLVKRYNADKRQAYNKVKDE